MEALKIEGLSKNFGGLEVLMGLSLSVRAGEHVAIIGPNGAGKTTLLNIITGELSATAGHVYIFGHEITTLPPHRRIHLGLGRSFQTVHLLPNLTVLRNILVAVQGIKPSRYQMFRPATTYGGLLAKAQRLLVAEGLWYKKDECVGNLSYGEQRRLEIALSLASDPRLLLLDEPSAGLTAAESADIVDIIRNLGKDIAVLIVAHDMDLVFGVAERIMVLHYGQIVVEGAPDVVRSDPKVKEIYMGAEEGTENAGSS